MFDRAGSRTGVASVYGHPLERGGSGRWPCSLPLPNLSGVATFVRRAGPVTQGTLRASPGWIERRKGVRETGPVRVVAAARLRVHPCCLVLATSPAQVSRAEPRGAFLSVQKTSGPGTPSDVRLSGDGPLFLTMCRAGQSEEKRRHELWPSPAPGGVHGNGHRLPGQGHFGIGRPLDPRSPSSNDAIARAAGFRRRYRRTGHGLLTSTDICTSVHRCSPRGRGGTRSPQAATSSGGYREQVSAQ